MWDSQRTGKALKNISYILLDFVTFPLFYTHTTPFLSSKTIKVWPKLSFGAWPSWWQQVALCVYQEYKVSK